MSITIQGASIALDDEPPYIVLISNKNCIEINGVLRKAHINMKEKQQMQRRLGKCENARHVPFYLNGDSEKDTASHFSEFI